MSGHEDWRGAARAALAAYPLTVAHMARVPQGLINLTIKVTDSAGRCFALQRLHPVFGAGVNRNLERVALHLRARGMLSPQLVYTRDGGREVELPDGRWRVLTWIEGRAFDALDEPAQAFAAARLLAAFHAALDDCAEPIEAERPPVHDLPRHLAALRAALAEHRGHRLATAADVLARRIERGVAALGGLAELPPRLVHGDPKISNVLFTVDGRRALCLLDLDTIARMPVALELGDALRSWCNPAGEDAVDARFELARMQAAIAGYEAGAPGLLSADERAAIVPATIAIHLELAARFLADALAERYFAFDSARYPARGEHNLARTRGQLAACDDLCAQRAAAEAVVAHRGTPWSR